MSAVPGMTLPYWFGGNETDDASGALQRRTPSLQLSPNATDETDLTRVERIKAGDASALDTVFLEFAPSLASFAYRFVGSSEKSQDIVHDVFLRLWMNREALALHGTLRGYLYAAVRNRALHDVAHTDVEARAAEMFLGTGTVPATYAGTAMAESPETRLLRDEIAHAVRTALATLPPRARLIAVLRWQDGLGRPEIGETLGISVGTVNKQLTIAARLLRDRLAALSMPEQ
jgi:RNA polymerase sigma-70 factor (ECF subfamily)